MDDLDMMSKIGIVRERFATIIAQGNVFFLFVAFGNHRTGECLFTGRSSIDICMMKAQHHFVLEIKQLSAGVAEEESAKLMN